MNFEQSVIETIKKRKSVRSFDIKSISQNDYELIKEYLDNDQNLKGPLGGKARFNIVTVNKNTTDKGIKIGTYGFIKNPKAYIVGINENNKQGLVEFGYIFERLILYLTHLNIGTCWLGGTFNRNSFEEEIDLKENEIIPCIFCRLLRSQQKRIFDRTVRFLAGSDNRKPWNELFFYSNFDTALTEEDIEDYVAPLEMIRLAPSASNKQPWRILVDKNKKSFHFFLEQTPKYSGNKIGFEMQRIDIGIAMCHFDLACKELNIKGHWKVEDPKVSSPNEFTEYIMTWENNQ